MTLFLPAEPVSNVTIRANVSETVEFNSPVVFTCSAKGSFLKFSWTSGTKPIIAEHTRLTIEDVRLYVCLYLIWFKFRLMCNKEGLNSVPFLLFSIFSLVFGSFSLQEATYSTLTISGIRSSDLVGPIYCTAANQLEMEKSAPLNLTVICKYCALCFWVIIN